MSDNDVIKHVVAITKKIDFNGNVNFDRKKIFFFGNFMKLTKNAKINDSVTVSEKEKML